MIYLNLTTNHSAETVPHAIRPERDASIKFAAHLQIIPIVINEQSTSNCGGTKCNFRVNIKCRRPINMMTTQDVWCIICLAPQVIPVRAGSNLIICGITDISCQYMIISPWKLCETLNSVLSPMTFGNTVFSQLRLTRLWTISSRMLLNEIKWEHFKNMRKKPAWLQMWKLGTTHPPHPNAFYSYTDKSVHKSIHCALGKILRF